MPLEIFEPGHERTVERHAQFFEPGQQILLGTQNGLLQPGDEVAAHLGLEPLVGAPPHFRGTQRACG